jgi:hypothetical protein
MIRMLFHAVILAITLWGGTPASFGNDPDELIAKTYSSTDHVWEMRVDPSARNGGGPGAYTMKRDGAEVWKREHPLTLWSAFVCRSGSTVGYSFEAGFLGPAAYDRDKFHESELYVVLLDPSGALVARHSRLRCEPGYGGTPIRPALPLAFDITADEANDRVIVWAFTSETPGVCWYRFRLSDLSPTGDLSLMPRSNPDEPVIALRPMLVPETGLVLVHWVSAMSNDKWAHFALLDFRGKEIWCMDIPDEYASDDVEHDRVRDGLPQMAVESNRFSIQSDALGASVWFEIVEIKAVGSATTIDVREVKREPWHATSVNSK